MNWWETLYNSRSDIVGSAAICMNTGERRSSPRGVHGAASNIDTVVCELNASKAKYEIRAVQHGWAIRLGTIAGDQPAYFVLCKPLRYRLAQVEPNTVLGVTLNTLEAVTPMIR